MYVKVMSTSYSSSSILFVLSLCIAFFLSILLSFSLHLFLSFPTKISLNDSQTVCSLWFLSFACLSDLDVPWFSVGYSPTLLCSCEMPPTGLILAPNKRRQDSVILPSQQDSCFTPSLPVRFTKQETLLLICQRQGLSYVAGSKPWSINFPNTVFLATPGDCWWDLVKSSAFSNDWAHAWRLRKEEQVTFLMCYVTRYTVQWGFPLM